MDFYLIDAFADVPFAGNPAVVVPLLEWPEERWLQQIAREMNQSETAFVAPENGQWRLRWFTPRVEVDLCGHATLATAYCLWNLQRVANELPIEFQTRSGTLIARQLGSTVELDFPVTRVEPVAPPTGLLSALGIEDEAGCAVAKSCFDYLVETPSAAMVRGLAPDFHRLREFGVRGTIVTAKSDDKKYDFLSRFFAPAAGIDEDPVTGSAHCALADYWQQRLGKTSFTAFQASVRGGVVHVRIDGERVFLGGEARLIARGQLLV